MIDGVPLILEEKRERQQFSETAHILGMQTGRDLSELF